MAYNDKKKQVDALTDQLNRSVSEYKKSPQDHVKLLQYMTQFKNYSIRNTMLIASQYKGAFGVKSYKEFQKDGFQVRKGQKSIKILAPRIEKFYKNENGSLVPAKYAKQDVKDKIKKGLIPTNEKIAGFLTVPVFDITQTNAPEEEYPNLYPNKPENYKFDGTEKELKAIEKTLEDYATQKGVSIKTAEINSAAKGFYSPGTNEIVLSNRLSDTNRIKTLLHELGHAEMHNPSALAKTDPTLNIPEVREYQAEMTAYIIGNQLGLDTEESSAKYIDHWVNQNDDFKKAINNLDNNKFIKSIEEVKEVSIKMIDQIVEKYNTIKVGLDKPVLEESQMNISKSNEHQKYTTRNTKEEIEAPAPNGDSKKNSENAKSRVAEKLKFLDDSNGKNQFNKLRNTTLVVAGIYSLDPKNKFQDHILKLKDNKNEEYVVHVTTPLTSKKDLLTNWGKGLTGDQWLKQDLKAEIMENKPEMKYNSLDIDELDIDNKMKPLEKLKQPEHTPTR